jgi:hypothetical protein
MEHMPLLQVCTAAALRAFVGSTWIAIVFDETTTVDALPRAGPRVYFNLEAGMVNKDKLLTLQIGLLAVTPVGVEYYYSGTLRLLHTEDPARMTMAKKADICASSTFATSAVFPLPTRTHIHGRLIGMDGAMQRS